MRAESSGFDSNGHAFGSWLIKFKKTLFKLAVDSGCKMASQEPEDDKRILSFLTFFTTSGSYAKSDYCCVSYYFLLVFLYKHGQFSK